MLKKILVTVLILLSALLLFATTRPDTFRVERAAAIAAPPEAIYPLLDDFHAWARWSPWEQLDPAMTRTFSGAPAGVGAEYAWKGNSKVGEGGMEITEAEPPRRLAVALHFVAPFETRSTAVFTLEPQGDSTLVTWTMAGNTPYLGKVMGLFFNMDKAIGADFEKGLAGLGLAVRAQPLP